VGERLPRSSSMPWGVLPEGGWLVTMRSGEGAASCSKMNRAADVRGAGPMLPIRSRLPREG
jgi:hypothetical protein